MDVPLSAHDVHIITVSLVSLTVGGDLLTSLPKPYLGGHSRKLFFFFFPEESLLLPEIAHSENPPLRPLDQWGGGPHCVLHIWSEMC